jgi:dTDP-4-amino-4,6-dideoxygalactose transaminase
MEIGSFFSSPNVLSKCDYENTVVAMLNEFNCDYYANGRSAIKNLIESQNIKKVLLPEYVCDSVINCFDLENIITYKLDNKLNIDVDDLLSKMTDDVTCIFIIHYFGSIQQDDILQRISVNAKGKNIIILEDTTHSIFSIPKTVGDYCICSLRKWFPIPDGAVLYADQSYPLPKQKHEEMNISKVLSAMALKSFYLENQIDNNDLYRILIDEYEYDLNQSSETYKISRYSYFLLQAFDIMEMKKRRLENYRYLQKYMLEKGIKPIVRINNSMCPLCFPIYVENRDSLHRYLIENGIYCAIHWPDIKSGATTDNVAVRMSEHGLSLPIDQRYTLDDIKYMITKIEKYVGII